jgi:hypothetical protein
MRSQTGIINQPAARCARHFPRSCRSRAGPNRSFPTPGSGFPSRRARRRSFMSFVPTSPLGETRRPVRSSSSFVLVLEDPVLLFQKRGRETRTTPASRPSEQQEFTAAFRSDCLSRMSSSQQMPGQVFRFTLGRAVWLLSKPCGTAALTQNIARPERGLFPSRRRAHSESKCLPGLGASGGLNEIR